MFSIFFIIGFVSMGVNAWMLSKSEFKSFWSWLGVASGLALVVWSSVHAGVDRLIEALS